MRASAASILPPALRRALPLAAALLFALGGPPAAWSASATASSASDSASSAASSTSTSIRRSSDGSSKATGVAQGEYRVIEVAAVPGEAGAMRVTLQAKADASLHGQWQLTLPPAVAQQAALAVGHRVQAQPRVYGVEFAHADTGRAFFLVLEDEWYRELPSRPVL